MFSLIIPIYNAKGTLKMCVDSVLAQTMQDFEIIMVDDGSTDDSGIICDGYASMDARIKVVHKNNEGVSSARNCGIENASGEWLMFVDSDDYIESDYLERFISESSSYDVVICGNRYVGSKSELASLTPAECNTRERIVDVLEANYWKDSFVTPWCKRFRASIIKDSSIYFKTGLNSGEDSLFVMEYLKHVKTLKVIDYCGYNYRVVDGQGLHIKPISYPVLDKLISLYDNSILELKHALGTDLSRYHDNVVLYFINQYFYGLRDMSIVQISRILSDLSHDYRVIQVFSSKNIEKWRSRYFFDILFFHKVFFMAALWLKRTITY